MILSAGTAIPTAFAETQNGDTLNQKSEQVIEQIQQNPELRSQATTASTSQTVATQAVYKHGIDLNQSHEYFFSTSGGNFTVKALHPATDSLEFFIYNFDTDKMTQPDANGNYNLTAGTYIFDLMSISETAINYEYQLNGPFSEQPDTTLPSLALSNPAKSEVRLSKSASSSFLVKGTTDANSLYLSSDSDYYELTAPGSFQQSINLEKGENYFTLSATEDSGNTLTTFNSITLPGVTRLEGKDRYEVSTNISKELSKLSGSSGTVIIARGDVFSDALSGGALASTEDAPILLTATAGLSDSVKAQIKALGAERAIILGGTGSVSTNVETQLKSLGVSTIERIGGKDRFAVSSSVADQVYEYWNSDTAIIASGEVFPDALSASSLAGPVGAPVLLVNKGNMPDSIKTFITNHPDIQNFIVVGGPATVNQTVLNQISSLRKDASIDRIGGKDRYEVSINVAQYGMDNYGLDLSTIAVARGDIFPDALSGAPLVNYFDAPILLTTSASLEPQVSSFLTNAGATDHVYILGGTGSVSKNTESQLFGKIK